MTASPFTPAVLPAWLPHVCIRHLMEEDLSALEWEGEYRHFRRVYADALLRMLRGEAVHWVAVLPGAEIIGQVFIHLHSERTELADGQRRAYLYSFRIRPPYRGQGLGTRMLHVVENDLRARHYHMLTLNVAKENLAARRLYERVGFHVTAHEPGIWSYLDPEGNLCQVEEPAWRMEKNL
jgi:ribosomal protein S18 acetylase RimI-like enzyme